MFVMPANAGIQVRFQFTIKNRLDSGFRRNGARVDFQSTNSEPRGLEPRVVKFGDCDTTCRERTTRELTTLPIFLGARARPLRAITVIRDAGDGVAAVDVENRSGYVTGAVGR